MNEHGTTWTDDPGAPRIRPFSELMDSGVLWLINTSVFHPRGYAMSVEVDDEGEVVGWAILGDGNERWAYEATDEMNATLDDRFAAVRRTLS